LGADVAHRNRSIPPSAASNAMMDNLNRATSQFAELSEAN